jgi:drug/metabolite transporter (DMT)-like permease
LDNRSSGIGYIVVIIAALLWAVSGSASKFLFNEGVSPFQLVQLRTTIGSSALCLWFLISDPTLLRITGRDLLYFLFLGAALAGLQFTYFYAISKIQVAAAILLQYQAPIFVALYGIVFSFEKITARVMVALLGAIFGCYLVVGAQTIDLLSLNRAGILAGISSAICFAWYSITSEYGMRKYKPWSVLFYALFFAAVIWNIFHPPLEAFRHKYNMWFLLDCTMRESTEFAQHVPAFLVLRNRSLRGLFLIFFSMNAWTSCRHSVQRWSSFQ